MPSKECDVINDVKLFLTVYRRIYVLKLFTLSKQTLRYKSKCIIILMCECIFYSDINHSEISQTLHLIYTFYVRSSNLPFKITCYVNISEKNIKYCY